MAISIPLGMTGFNWMVVGSLAADVTCGVDGSNACNEGSDFDWFSPSLPKMPDTKSLSSLHASASTQLPRTTGWQVELEKNSSKLLNLISQRNYSTQTKW